MDLQAKLDSIKAPLAIDVVRVLVACFIIFKGYAFTSNFESITVNIQSIGMVYLAIPIAHYVIFTHMICGSLLLLGAYTRWMAIANLPILFGAIIFNTQNFLVMDVHIELGTALIVLAALLAITYFGGGKYSFEEILRRRAAKKNILTP
jgi:uncharacterized membrane protein YphA (DoxX/SURF4 family)